MENSISKRNNKLPLIIGIVAAVAVVATVLIVYALGSDNRKLKAQLDLGYKYLQELNYEQAVAAFTDALEIDDMNVEAYLGLAQGYVGLARQAFDAGNTDEALAYCEDAKTALEKGIDRTGDSTGEMQAYIDNTIIPLIDEINDSLIVEVVEEPYSIEFINVSLSELVMSPSVNGVSWLEYGSVDAMRAAFPQMQPRDTDDKYMEWADLGNKEGLVRYYESADGYRQFIIWTDYDTGHNSTASVNNIIFDERSADQSPRYSVSSDYFIGVSALPYGNGFQNFMESHGLVSATDVISYLGLDVAAIQNGDIIFIDSEYGKAMVYGNNHDGWQYSINLCDDEGNYISDFSILIQDGAATFSDHSVVHMHMWVDGLLN